MEHAPVALNAIKLGAQHFDKVKEPAQSRLDKMRGKAPRPDPECLDTRIMEEKGYVLKRRGEVESDEEIVEVVRHRGQVLPRRPQNRRRTSSVDGRRYGRDASGYGSDSEGSVPPRRRRARSTGGRSRRGRSSSSSSSSSSQLGSSSGEEQEMKKIRRKKWITAGFASVATIHAASKVYSSIEKHDQRVIAVQQGTLSPEDAHKQARAARWQDAAAIGIAALGIKGALSEWKEMAEEHEHHKELMEKHEEQHRRRIEHVKRKKARENGGYYKASDGYWYYNGTEPQYAERYNSRRSTGDYNRLDGPRQSERRMIEGPPQRSRSVYDRDQSRSQNHDDSRDSSPVRSRKVSSYDR